VKPSSETEKGCETNLPGSVISRFSAAFFGAIAELTGHASTGQNPGLITADRLIQSTPCQIRSVGFHGLKLRGQVLIHDVGEPVSAERFLFRFLLHLQKCLDLSLP
jgi:hypothetical protein